MAFVPWKDRVTATPHRYKLTEVGADTYDLEAVPGAVSEAGTPVNAENLDKLIQRDGDDIKDNVVAFTEAGARANIATGESTATLFGKIKKYFTDLKTHAFTAPSTAQGTGTTTVPCDNILKESSFARVYREATEIPGITQYPVAIGVVLKTMKDQNLLNTILTVGCSNANENKITGLPVIGSAIQTYGMLVVQVPGTDALRMRVEYSREIGTGNVIKWIGGINRTDPNNWTVDWRMIIDDSSDQKISGVKEFTASPIVPTTPSGPSAAVAKSYADSLRTVYDKVIRTQTEFEALIASATWLGATSVALVGPFTLSTANNIGIKIPATVKQIHGFNSAKITVTNYLYNSSTAKGGLWYDTAPTTNDYSIRDLEVDCTGTGSLIRAFYNCIGLYNCTGTGTGETVGRGFSDCNYITNCTGTGSGSYGYGFYDCNYITNCTGTGSGSYGRGFYDCNYITNCTGTGSGSYGYGFSDCNYITNCTGTGTGENTGLGFYGCLNLSNCTGKGVDSTDASNGYGFYDITRASNCEYIDSSTDMWGGTNKNIDLDTCCKNASNTPANNTTLNT